MAIDGTGGPALAAAASNPVARPASGDGESAPQDEADQPARRRADGGADGQLVPPLGDRPGQGAEETDHGDGPARGPRSRPRARHAGRHHPQPKTLAAAVASSAVAPEPWRRKHASAKPRTGASAAELVPPGGGGSTSTRSRRPGWCSPKREALVSSAPYHTQNATAIDARCWGARQIREMTVRRPWRLVLPRNPRSGR